MKKQFDHDLAAWMRRAAIPVEVIGASMGVSGMAVRRVSRARPQTLRLAWCPPEHRAEYASLRSKVGAEAARTIVERDLMGMKR